MTRTRTRRVPLGPTPYGYERLSDGSLAALVAEADVVRWIFDAYLGCSSLREIATSLNARGVRSPRPERRPSRHSLWLRGSVWSIIRNRAYAGSIIESEVWRCTQRALKRNRSKPRARA